MPQAKAEITRLLRAWSDGDQRALDQLVGSIHGRLQRLAASFLRHERADHTLQTTALVNEAFLRLVDQDQVRWRDRAHFLAIAGQMMRRILVDHARRKGYKKRGGDAKRISAEELEHLSIDRHPDLVALDDALSSLAENDEVLSQLVELKYFGGLTKEEIAEVLGVSSATVTRRWRVAKAWLYRYLVRGETDDL